MPSLRHYKKSPKDTYWIDIFSQWRIKNQLWNEKASPWLGAFVCLLSLPKRSYGFGKPSLPPQLREGETEVAFSTSDAGVLFGLSVSITVFWLSFRDLNPSQEE
jgi:hypothetical protein